MKSCLSCLRENIERRVMLCVPSVSVAGGGGFYFEASCCDHEIDVLITRSIC